MAVKGQVRDSSDTAPKHNHHDGWEISHLSLVVWALVTRCQDMVGGRAEGWDAFPPHHLSPWSFQGLKEALMCLGSIGR